MTNSKISDIKLTKKETYYKLIMIVGEYHEKQ